MATFLDKFTMLCLEKGVAPTRVCEDIGITRSAFVRWRQGQMPRNTTLRSLADYFGVSIDSLKDDSAEIVKSTPVPATLSKQEQELLTIYRSLSLSGQLTLIQTALALRNKG